jgi:hypothetical protein
MEAVLLPGRLVGSRIWFEPADSKGLNGLGGHQKGRQILEGKNKVMGRI